MLGHPFGDSGIHDKVLSGNETRDPAERRGNGPAVTSSQLRGRNIYPMIRLVLVHYQPTVQRL